MENLVGKIVLMKLVVPSLGIETPPKIAEVKDVQGDFLFLYLPDVKKAEWINKKKVKIIEIIQGEI